MYKRIGFLVIVFFSLITFDKAYATSGACSSHLGVNCSVGPAGDGSVTCNDGWSNSSVNFYSADECKPNLACTSPSSSGSGCKTENDYGALSLQLSRTGGFDSLSGTSALNQCRSQITAYQTQQQEYQSCLNQNQTQSSNYYSGMQQETARLNLESSQTLKNIDCMTKYLKAHYDQGTNQCVCDTGMWNDGVKCTTPALYCITKYGLFADPDLAKSTSTTAYCKCTNDYQLNSSQQCAPIAQTNANNQTSKAVVASPNPSDFHSVGVNIKTPNGTIYMITSSGFRRPYTSAGAFLSYGFNTWATVVDSNSADETLLETTYIPPRDGKIVCSDRGTDKGTCYLITNSKKAGFTSAKVFNGLGFSFKNTTSGDMSWMNSTNNIDNAQSAHLPGTLIKNNGNYQLVVSGGIMNTTLDIAKSWGYPATDAVTANKADSGLTNLGSLNTRQAGELLPK